MTEEEKEYRIDLTQEEIHLVATLLLAEVDRLDRLDAEHIKNPEVKCEVFLLTSLTLKLYGCGP